MSPPNRVIRADVTRVQDPIEGLKEYVGERFDAVDRRVDEVNIRIGGVDNRVEALEATHREAAKTAGRSAGGVSGAKWAAAILALLETLKMVGPPIVKACATLLAALGLHG